LFGKCAAGFVFEVGGEVLFDEGLGQQFFAFGQAVCEAVCFGGGCGIRGGLGVRCAGAQE
jgi:hypothetical protein